MNKSYRGIVAVAALSLLPAVIWLTLGSVGDRFGSGPAALRSLGQLGGLSGLAMMSVGVLLSTRIRIVDRLLGGFDKAIVIHRWLGGIGFFLVLAHPLLLAGQYAYISTKLAWRFLWPWTNGAEIGGGFAALVIMVALVPLVHIRRLKYHLWEISHRFLGLVLVLGVLHMLELGSDTAASFLLRSYMVLLAAPAIAVWSWQSVVKLVYRGKRRFRVSGVKRLSDSVCEVSIEPVGREPLSFQAGQFVFVAFDDAAVGRERHPFTISSSPSEPVIRLTIKTLGDWSEKVGGLKPGTAVWLEGPFGFFVPASRVEESQVWVAGGIGITPFVSAARAMEPGQFSGPIDLFYCVSVEKDAIFMDELRSLSEKIPELKVHLVCDETTGRISTDLIRSAVGELDTKSFWLCGPEGLVRSMRSQLKSAGVRSEDVHFERFAFK